MAKLAVTFTLTFFFFTLCYARIPTGITENDVAGDEQLETTTTSPAADTILPSWKPIITSEKHEPVATMVPLDIDSKLPESDAMESDSNSIPLTMISIHPIDRHFPRHPFPLMFRHGHRCRHHRHPRHDQQDQVHEFKPWGPRFPNREVPYGDDMIVVDEKDSGPNPESRGVVHQIPGRSIRFKKFGHEGPSFHHVDVEAVSEDGSRFHRFDVEAREEDINEKDSGLKRIQAVREKSSRFHRGDLEAREQDINEKDSGLERIRVKFSHEGPRLHHGDVEAREEDINEKRSSFDPESRGVMRHIPGRFKFSHEGPRFHLWHDDVEGREHMMMKKKRHHRHGEREEWEHEHERKRKHKHEDGFMKRVSKFLDLF